MISLQVRIRDANDRDVLGLEAVINQRWRVNIDHRKELKNPDAILLVAEIKEVAKRVERKIVGTALMWVTTWNKTGYLVELAVDNAHQRKGLASRIVQALAKRAKQRELRAIIVETQLDNKQGMDFYLSKGFRLCGYNDRYYTNNPRSSHEIAIFFSLDLRHTKSGYRTYLAADPSQRSYKQRTDRTPV